MFAFNEVVLFFIWVPIILILFIGIAGVFGEEYKKYFGLALVILILIIEIGGARAQDPKVPNGTNLGVGGMIGKDAEVIQDCTDSSGKVRIKNEIWNAKTSDGTAIKAGERIVIQDVVGLTLIVKKM